MPSKSEIRKSIRQQRKALTATEQQQAADDLAHHLQLETFFCDAKQIAFYYAHQGELNTHTLLNAALQQHKQCYLPILDPKKTNHLLFAEYNSGDQLKNNRYGIPEPILQADKLIEAQQLDVVFTPLVAFDRQGNRLGMGAGYYDRSFAFMHNNANKKPLLIGIAYEFQKIANLPSDEWDIPLHAIATEKTTYWSK